MKIRNLRNLVAPLACLALAVLALPATGQSSSERVALDQRVSDAKLDLLRAEANVERQRLALRFPPYARTSFYVDKRASGFVLESIRVLVDGREVVSYGYSPAEARALFDRNLHRVARIALAPGEHTLVTEFSGRRLERRGEGTPVAGRSEVRFIKDTEPLDIILPVEEKGRELADPEFRQTTAPGSKGGDDLADIRQITAGGALDPRLGHARFLNATGRNFGALVELRQVGSGAGDAPLPAPYQWLLAESYLAFGMHQPAAQTLRRLALMDVDARRLAELQLDLAEFEYQRGYLFEAVERLRRLRNKLQEEQIVRWQDITSRVLLAQGRYREAADVLQERPNRSDHSLYMRFNLGVALLRGGEIEKGRTALDELARDIGSSDPVTLALRDRTNLVLGYHFLRNRLGGTAKPMFERIRVQGPYSNRALLGMGWAELAPEGTRQRRSAVDDLDPDDERVRNVASLGVLVRPGFFEAETYRRLANRPFRRASIGDDEEEALQRALAVWSELTERDPMDPAVQEGLLAIPYALDRLGAQEQALEAYLRAIDVFEEARTRINRGIDSVESALMLNTIVRRDAEAQSGYNWRLLDLPDLPETYWLNALLAEHRFQEQLKNYRDARLLAERIKALRTSAPDELRATATLPPPPPSQLFARQFDVFDRADLPALRLREARLLGSPSPGRVAPPPPNVPRLREAAIPPHFDGPREAYLRDVAALGKAQRRIERLAEEQSKAVRTLAIEELESQRSILEKYLLEARFAVARIYDRRLPGGDGAP